MRQAFNARLDSAERERHLWAGLRHDPTWLLNRGVLALVLRAAGRRLRGRPPERQS
jgi:hypothetical protein